MSGNRHYTDELFIALRDGSYEEANEMVLRYVRTGEPLTSQAYFGIGTQGRNTEFLWTLILNYESLEHKNTLKEKGNYYQLIKDISTYRGASRRINFLIKKASNGEGPQLFRDHVLSYVCIHSRKEKEKKMVALLKGGANPLTPFDGYPRESVMDRAVNSSNKEMFQLLAIQDDRVNVELSDSLIQQLAEKGLMQEWLEDYLSRMTTDHFEVYQSYLLLDEMNRS